MLIIILNFQASCKFLKKKKQVNNLVEILQKLDQKKGCYCGEKWNGQQVLSNSM